MWWHSNFEAPVSELLENIEEIFPRDTTCIVMLSAASHLQHTIVWSLKSLIDMKLIHSETVQPLNRIVLLTRE